MERTAESDRENRPPEERPDPGQEADRPNARRDPVASLHQSAGNQAVQRLHERGEIQATLRVSRPDDPQEREAERVAEQVLRTPDVDLMSDSSDGVTVDRKSGSGTGRTVAESEDRERIESATHGGKPLEPATRSYFESKFGRDFGDVRVHTGPEADEAARSINADAFTYGTDVVFRSGQYQPATRSGKELLAHELTHVVQQTSDRGAVQRQENQQSEDTAQSQDERSLEDLKAEADQYVDVGQITQEFFEWASENYIIPRHRYLEEGGNWADMGPTHKDDDTEATNTREAVLGAYEDVGQDPSMTALKWGATAMGIGITIMVGVEIYALWGVSSAATQGILFLKGTSRGVAHAPGIAQLFQEDEVRVDVSSGNATRLQMGFFWIYIAGDEGVQDRFLDQRSVPDNAKPAVKEVISRIADQQSSQLSE